MSLPLIQSPYARFERKLIIGKVKKTNAEKLRKRIEEERWHKLTPGKREKEKMKNL